MADTAAFEILYQEYYPRVFALCRFLLPSQHSAEDAAQETFARAYRSFAQYTPGRPFWQWISAIAHRHCVDQLRERHRWRPLEGDAQEVIDRLQAPEPVNIDALIIREDQQRLRRAIDQLPEKYRVPLVLAYLGNLSYDQIAQLLEITPNHVGVLLLRARQQLRDHLKPMTAGGPVE